MKMTNEELHNLMADGKIASQGADIEKLRKRIDDIMLILSSHGDQLECLTLQSNKMMAFLEAAALAKIDEEPEPVTIPDPGTDLIADWGDEIVVFTGDKRDWVSSVSMYNSYMKWCKNYKGDGTLTQREFVAKFKKAHSQNFTRYGKKRVGEKFPYGFYGVKFHTEHFR